MMIRTAVRLAVELKTFLNPSRTPLKISKGTDDPNKPNGKVLQVKGLAGLVSSSGSHFTDAHYELARVAIGRELPKGAQLEQHSFIRYAVTRKLPGSKMGRGKGDIQHYEYRIRPHTPVFEITGNIHPQDAKFALLEGAKRLPGKWMVKRTGWLMPSFKHLEDARRRAALKAQKEAQLGAIKAGLADGSIVPNSPAGPIAFPSTKYFPHVFSLPTTDLKRPPPVSLDDQLQKALTQ
eukprot:EG_transcript_26376